MAAKLILTRKGGFFTPNRRHRYKVFIDGTEVGQIKHDDTEEYILPPGTHTLQCRINWMSSPVETVELSEGVNTYRSVSSGMKFIGPLYIIFFAGAFLPFFFRQVAKVPIPDYARTLQFILVLPALIYLILYASVFRKKYLLIGEDKSNPFK
jgi:hypothetical protein